MYKKITKLIRRIKASINIRKRNNPIMKPEDVICAVPWMHLAFEPSGKIVPCCLTSHHNYFAGDLNKESIEEIWNGEPMKALRKEMIEGREPKICSTCFDRERVTGESARTFHEKEFKNVIKIIPEITKPDGSVTEMKLRYWDFRFSNLCNMKCRSCGPRFSSAWVPDAKKLGWINEQDKVWNIEQVDDKTNYDFLKDQVQYVQKVYFAGGEPLLMPEHWQILDMLVENKKFDVKISYNTNALTLTHGKKSALDYWKLWDDKKVEVWPSIDEIGERAELIRSGTVWSKVEENLKKITALENVWIRPGITIGAWNVRRIPVILDHLIEIGVIKQQFNFENFFFNLLQNPVHYHISILPDSYKEETYKELEAYIENYNKTYKTNIGWIFAHILHELKKPHDPSAAKKFLEISKNLDTIRNEDIFKTIPEMSIINSMYPNIYN
jgi:radical SAM protein with 4Fe4S-binding SPASM domain